MTGGGLVVRIAIGAAAVGAAIGRADATPLLIAPTTVQFAPDRHSAAVEVTNESPRPTTLQFRVFGWSQGEERDRLDAGDDLIVSPAIVTVPPHAKQVFRVLDRRPAPSGAERSYRLKLSELPGPATSAIVINVEFSLPVFITPASATQALSGTVAGREALIVNRGTRRVHLATLSLRDRGGADRELVEARGIYVLAGATRRLPLPAGTAVGPAARLTGTTDTGPIDVPLAITAPR